MSSEHTGKTGSHTREMTWVRLQSKPRLQFSLVSVLALGTSPCAGVDASLAGCLLALVELFLSEVEVQGFEVL